jgi:hypothetical protein
MRGKRFRLARMRAVSLPLLPCHKCGSGLRLRAGGRAQLILSKRMRRDRRNAWRRERGAGWLHANLVAGHGVSLQELGHGLRYGLGALDLQEMANAVDRELLDVRERGAEELGDLHPQRLGLRPDHG